MKSRFRIPLIPFLSLVLLGGAAQAETFNPTNSTELQAALTTAAGTVEPDEINLPAGTFLATDNGAPFIYFSFNTGDLTIQGAGSDATTLDGTDNLSVLQIVSIGGNIRVADLAIKNGNSALASGLFLGTNTGNIEIDGIELTDNHSTNVGALFLNTQQADIAVKNSTIQNNWSDNDFGAFQIIVSSQGQINFEDNAVIGNFTTNGTEGAGSLISAGTAPMTISGNRFEGNNCSEEIGAIEANAAELILDGNTFFDNSAAFQGAFLLSADQVTLSNNLLDQNNASSSNLGIGSISGEAVSLVNNIITGNTASAISGLRIVSSEQTTLTNNTLARNRSVIGPVIEILANNPGSDTRIYNNIFFDNLASNLPNDILVSDNNGADIGNPVTFARNIFAVFNSACQNDGVCAPNANVTATDNLVNIDPLFVDLLAGDVHLRGDSQAVDFGDPNAPLLPAQDFAGNPRSVNGAPDLGALELVSQLTVDPNAIDFGALLINTEASRTVTLRNQGDADVSVTGIVLGAENAYRFDVNGGANPCGATSFVLNADESCTVAVSFAPTSEGVQDNQLQISSNDAFNPNLNVSLTGKANATPEDGDEPDSGGCSCSFESSASTINGAWLWIFPALGLGIARLRRR